MRRTTRLPLNAADASLLALDRFMDGGRVGKNLVHLVVELDREPEPTRVTRALERFVRVSPWPSSRLRRGAPMFPPYWLARTDGEIETPPVTTHAVDTTDRAAIDAFLENRLDVRIDPFAGAPVRFDVVRPTVGSSSPYLFANPRHACECLSPRLIPPGKSAKLRKRAVEPSSGVVARTRLVVISIATPRKFPSSSLIGTTRYGFSEMNH